MKKRIITRLIFTMLLAGPMMVLPVNNSAPQLDDERDSEELDFYPVHVEEKSWLVQSVHKIGCDMAAVCIRCKRYVMRKVRQFLRMYLKSAKRLKKVRQL